MLCVCVCVCVCRTSRQLAHICEMALRDKASLKSQVSRPFMVLVCALLAGDSRAADALTATLAQQQLPSVLATIEDYMWCKLTLLLASQVCDVLSLLCCMPPMETACGVGSPCCLCWPPVMKGTRGGMVG
jgi:hypothetical protein